MLFACFAAAHNTPAQEPAQGAAQKSRNFLRLLTWSAEPLAQRYSIRIERKNEGGAFEPYTTKFTIENELYCALPEGNYRYAVAANDIKGNNQGYSSWVYFECKAPKGSSGKNTAQKTEGTKLGYPVRLRSISVYYTPLIAVSGDLFSVFNTAFFPQGLGLNAALNLYSAPFGDFSAALEADWNYLYGEQESQDIAYNAAGHFFGIALQLGYRKFIYHKIIDINATLDVGYDVISAEKKGDDVIDKKSTILPCMGIGIFAGYHVANKIIISAGMRISYIFSPDEKSPLCLRPFLGVGWSPYAD